MSLLLETTVAKVLYIVSFSFWEKKKKTLNVPKSNKKKKKSRLYHLDFVQFKFISTFAPLKWIWYFCFERMHKENILASHSLLSIVSAGEEALTNDLHLLEQPTIA